MSDDARWRALAAKLRLPRPSPLPLGGPADDATAEFIAKMRETDAALRRQARDAFIEGDASGLLCSFPNTYGLSIVFKNAPALRERGIYEAALVDAYVGTRTNWSEWSLDDFELLISAADPEKLRAAAGPIPEGDTFTLYRGVDAGRNVAPRGHATATRRSGSLTAVRRGVSRIPRCTSRRHRARRSRSTRTSGMKTTSC